MVAISFYTTLCNDFLCRDKQITNCLHVNIHKGQMGAHRRVLQFHTKYVMCIHMCVHYIWLFLK